MVHPLVDQLRFARSEFIRGLDGVTEAEAQRRFLPMNCISWNVGHLAWQEQRYWLDRAQSKVLLPDVNDQFAYRAPASTPALDDARRAWRAITSAADPWLDAVSTETLLSNVMTDGKPSEYTFGSLLQRMLYHYWYHTGENAAIRQQLGHAELPEFVGDIDHEAPYRPESDA
ncbi:MAG: DinB family protein [Dehalococcoidia bacterium]